MNIDRKVVEQALEAWQTSSYGQPSHQKLMVLAMTAMQQALANEALDRMAENARELGLDYTITQTGVGIGKRAEEAYEAAKERGWIGLSDHRLMEQPAQVQVPVKDNTYGYAKSLAEAIFKQHFASDEHYASGRIVWGVNDTVIGILTQIDNMVADMVRRPAQQEPVAWQVMVEDEAMKEFSTKDIAHDWCVQQKLSGSSYVYWIRPLYASQPAQRTWVGLTDDEIHDIYDEVARREPYNMAVTRRNIARAIEAKLKEKNT
jgi:hypothetical protein